jgi:hypothetical protein
MFLTTKVTRKGPINSEILEKPDLPWVLESSFRPIRSFDIARQYVSPGIVYLTVRGGSRLALVLYAWLKNLNNDPMLINLTIKKHITS